MKKSIFVAGIVLLFCSLESCKEDELIIDPVLFETTDMKTAVSGVVDAFQQKDTARIRSLILPNYYELYKTQILNGNQQKLAEFGKLLQSVKLIAGDSIYVVYKYTYSGNDYEISFSKDEKGKWKIMNF